jgi:hypothetical protein
MSETPTTLRDRLLQAADELNVFCGGGQMKKLNGESFEDIEALLREAAAALGPPVPAHEPERTRTPLQ